MSKYVSQRKWFFGAAVAAALASTVSAAYAADLGGSIKDGPVYAEPVRHFSWRGFYVGATAGAAWDRNGVDFGPGSNAANIYFSGGAVPGSISGGDGARFIGGATAGYNMQSGPIVYGVELDYSGLTGDGDHGTVTTNAPGFVRFDTTASSRVDQLLTLRARVGYTVSPRTLLYVTGGYAAGDTHLSSSITTPGTGCSPTGQCASGSSSGWKSGWTAGAGIEHALTHQWSIKGEYLHYDLGSASFGAADPGSPFIVYNTRAKFEGDIVRAGLNFKF